MNTTELIMYNENTGLSSLLEYTEKEIQIITDFVDKTRNLIRPKNSMWCLYNYSITPSISDHNYRGEMPKSSDHYKIWRETFKILFEDNEDQFLLLNTLNLNKKYYVIAEHSYSQNRYYLEFIEILREVHEELSCNHYIK